MGRSLSLDDELDALLDAPLGDSRLHVSAELAPLVAVATALRAELATVVPDPGVARRQISHAIGMPRLAAGQLAGNGHDGAGWRIGTDVPLRPGRQGDLSVQRMADWRGAARAGPSRLRRRVAAIALAAALLLIPATIASGRSLPGQPLYPVKLSVEDVRLAGLAWSPGGTARERLRIADVRLDELSRLADSHQVERVPDAVLSLRAAVDAAAQAVDQASLQEVDSDRAVALRQNLSEVQNRQIIRLTNVAARLPTTSPAARQALEVAQQALVSAKLQQQRRTNQP
jgi:Domain of unknown function (DUF5667)